MRTPSFDVKILVEKVRVIRGYLRYVSKLSGVLCQESTSAEHIGRQPIAS